MIEKVINLWIMKGDRVVAKPFKKGGIYWGLRREPGLTFIDTPIALFGFTAEEVTLEKFYSWVKKRCCPPDRVDIDEVLAAWGMEKYDALELVKKTNAVLTGVDDFWVDFSKW